MTTILILLTAHWISDFMLQSRRDAEAKSHDIWALLRHVGTYSVLMTLVVFFIFPAKEAIIFGIITFVIHFITDYFTSKATTYCYLKTQNTFDFMSNDWNLKVGTIITTTEKVFPVSLRIATDLSGGKYKVTFLKEYDKWSKAFWSMIGFDQLLHTVQILLTYQYIY
jgi:hypothetical protein